MPSPGVPYIVTSDAANHNNGVAGALTTAAVPAGALIVAAVNNPSGSLLTTMHDSGGVNVYNKAVALSATRDMEWWYCLNASALSSGATFTGTSNGTQWSAAVYAVTGASGGLDKTASQSKNTTGAMVTATGQLTNASEIAFFGVNSGTANITTDPSWTTLSTGFVSYLLTPTSTGASNTLLIGTANTVVGALATFQLDANTGEADGIATAPAIGVTGIAAAATGAGVAPGIGAAAVAEPGTATGIGAAPGVGLGTLTGTVITGVGAAAGIGAAPGIGAGNVKRVVGWFEEWDEPPPPIKRANLEAIRRVQRNNGWINAGRVFRSLNKSTKRMKRDQNIKDEDF